MKLRLPTRFTRKLVLFRKVACYVFELNYDADFHAADILPFPVPSNSSAFDVLCIDTELVSVLHLKC